MEEIIFGLDIGTTKVCALVGAVREGQLQIIGLGIEPSRGMRKGMVVDVREASVVIASAIEAAEQTSRAAADQARPATVPRHLGPDQPAGHR